MEKFLIVGLGNVGKEYAHTRHNIGFDVLSELVRKYEGSFAIERLANISSIKIKGRQVVCICPTTFMNLSGRAFKYWLEKEKVPLKNTLTVVDDLSLPLDKIRLRSSGTHAGHNGLRDIENILGTDEYPKLRFGIGNQFPRGMQAEFVLSKWLPDEEILVQLKISKCVEAIEQFIFLGIERAMTTFNKISIK